LQSAKAAGFTKRVYILAAIDLDTLSCRELSLVKKPEKK
jgi:hypothetical protein